MDIDSLEKTMVLMGLLGWKAQIVMLEAIKVSQMG